MILMTNPNIFFVAYQDQENLGIGYLSSMLAEKGYSNDVLDIRSKRSQIAERIIEADPMIVGFSLIFQFHAPMFKDLVKYLRDSGVKSHFTIGGHYPSLRYRETLDFIPEMDSVVRFEGEYTVCELADCLVSGEDWRKIDGIAYRVDGKPVSNPLRPMINNLDALPFPTRRKQEEFVCMGINYATILASRGCIRNCSFCSVRKFYTTPPGKIRRTRSPKNVVNEIKFLNARYGSKIFLFQDDDFILPGKAGRNWINEYLNELVKEGLGDEVIWKISCRPDEIDEELLRKMRERGLFLVYFGLESGNEKGLKLLNKEIGVDDSVKAIELLKKLDINYEFGFMMFDPSSTFESVRENMAFLRRICGDGSSPIVLTRMLPLAETPIEKVLATEGRLKGTEFNPDYEFNNSSMDEYCDYLTQLFNEWMHSHQGLLARLRWHRFEVAALEKYYPHAKGIPEYKKTLAGIIASSNNHFFKVALDASILFEEKPAWHWDDLNRLQKYHVRQSKVILDQLTTAMNNFQEHQKE